jgi:hypothetical protein
MNFKTSTHSKHAGLFLLAFRFFLALGISLTATQPIFSQTEVCDDGIDNDGDSNIDCADTDCSIAANAGPDQIHCNNGTFTLAANAPPAGATGLWTISSGTGTIASPASPTTTVTGVPAGTSITLIWTLDNTLCADLDDDVTLVNQATMSITRQPIGFSEVLNETLFLSVNMAGGTLPYTYQWQSSTTGAGAWVNVTGETNPTYTPPSATAGDNWYRVIIGDSGGANACPGVTSTAAKVTVLTESVVTVCSGGGVILTATYWGDAGTYNLQWQEQIGCAGGWTDIAGETSATLTSGALTGDMCYRAIYTCPGSGCSPVVSNTTSVDVQPEATVSIIGATTVCVDGAATLTATIGGGTGTCTLQWQKSPNGTAWTDMAGENATALNVTLLAATTHYRAIYSCTAADCEPAISNVEIITVNPDPNITTQPVGNTICAGGTQNISVIAADGVALTYQWQYNNAGTWEDASANSPADATYTGATTATLTASGISAVGSHNYRVIITDATSGCNTVISSPATLIINPGPSIATQPVGNTICTQGTHNFDVVPSGGVALTYQWQYDNGGTWQNVTAASPAGATYTGMTTPNMTASGVSAVGTHGYRVIITDGTSGCAPVISNVADLIINADPSITTQPVGNTICAGGTQDISITAANGVALTYQWQFDNGGTWEDVTASSPSGATYTGATTATLTTDGITAVGNHNYRVIIADATSGCNTIISNTATLIINYDPTIVTEPVGNTICAGGLQAISVVASDGVALNYQWQYNNGGTWENVTANSPTDATYTGATTATLTTNGISAVGNHDYRVIISDATSGCNTTNSAVATLTINPGPSIATQPVGTTICSEGTHNFLVIPSGGVALTYQWQYDNGGTWQNVTAASPAGATYVGATTPSLTASGVSAVGTHDYRVIITDGTSGCAAVVSNTANLTINADPSITTQPVGNTICVGGTQDISVTAANGVALTYQWQYDNAGTWENVTAASPAGVTYTGATTATLTTDGITAVGNHDYRVIITDATSGCNSITSGTASLIINADPSITAQPIGNTICAGGTQNISVTAANGVALTFQWQYDNAGTWENVTAASPAGATYTGATTATLTTNGISAVGNHDYRVIISDATSGCNTTNSAVATLTINPGPSIATQPVGTTICSEGTHNFLVIPSGGVALTYQWQYDNAGTWQNVTAASPAGATYVGATTPSLTTSGVSAVGTHGYRVIITDGTSGCAPVISNVADLIINADPSIATQPVGNTICVGGTQDISVTAANGVALTYQWQYDNAGTWQNVTAASPAGATYTGATTATLTTDGITAVGNHDYRVIITDATSGCNSITSGTATLIINADPIITTQPTGAAMCTSGSQILTVTAANGVALAYQWQLNNGGTWSNVTAGTPTGAAYTGNTAAAMTVSDITAVGVFDYRVIVSDATSGCNSIVSSNATVDVQAGLTASITGAGGAYCAGTVQPLKVIVGGAIGTITYQWQSSPNGSTWTNVGTNAPKYSTGVLTDTIHYQVIVSVSGSGCNAVTTVPVVINVAPDPSISVSVGDTICTGQNYTMTANVVNGQGTCNIQWQQSITGANFTDIPGATGTTYTATNMTQSTYFRATYSCSAGDCGNAVATPIFVKVTPAPIIRTGVSGFTTN